MQVPRWVQPRIGPLLRGGVDLRSYIRQILLIGVFDNDDYCRYHQRGARFSEPSLGDAPPKGPGTIVFSGIEGLFAPFNQYRLFIRRRLIEIARMRWKRVAASVPSGAIGINVRLAQDFRPANTPDDHYSRVARTPLQWYVEALQFVRAAAGRDVPAVVVSDGRARELVALLRLPDVKFLRPGCAISDLLGLSRTRLLIGTAQSSFSAWASFLGGMTTVVHPGQSFDMYGFTSDRYVGSFDPAAPTSAFLRDLAGF